MGRKIFVSYKFSDDEVFPLHNADNATRSSIFPLTRSYARTILGGLAQDHYSIQNRNDQLLRQELLDTLPTNLKTTVRSYVDKLEEFINKSDLYKGESNNDDLSHYSDEYIWDKLKDRIYDSSVTIVVISKGMKEANKSDKSQWIPWEISYSLKEMTRNDRTSRSNAMLALVLPDRDNSYQYFFDNYSSGNFLFKNEVLFSILQKNMFNLKKPDVRIGITDDNEHSYISPVKWSDFILFAQTYIDNAVQRQSNIQKYNIFKDV